MPVITIECVKRLQELSAIGALSSRVLYMSDDLLGERDKFRLFSVDERRFDAGAAHAGANQLTSEHIGLFECFCPSAVHFIRHRVDFDLSQIALGDLTWPGIWQKVFEEDP